MRRALWIFDRLVVAVVIGFLLFITAWTFPVGGF